MGAASHVGSGSGATGQRGRRARAARRVAWAAICSAIGALFLPAPANAGVNESLAQARGWLITQQNADGSFGTGGELLPRDSAVAVQALAAGAADPAIARGADYLGSLQEQVAHFRALRVQGLAATGRPFEPLLDTLGDFRNGSGFGAFGAYYSNLLDTILAVEAYSQDERDRQLLIVELLDYLLASQGSDGGWGFVPGSPSQVYYTGEALWALARLQALDVSPTVVSRARDYLVSQRQANGSFGSLVETAVAYRALIAAGYQLPAGQPDTVAMLLAAQDASGSWSGDAYTTAEVMRALSAHVPNLIVATLTPSATTITAGTPLDVTAVVRNIGPLAAGTSRIELRSGSATGAVRAQAAVPALAPGASHTATFQVSTTGDQGELVLYAVADAGNEVAEGNELDNTQSVRVALRGLPDLAIFPAQITTSVARPQPGAAFQVRATVQNLGEMPVASFAYRITRVVAGAPVQTLAQGTTTQSLAPGGSLILTANATLPEGEHTVYVELDPANAIEESYEQDNDATMTFFVVDDTIADFHVTDADLVATPASPAPGTLVNFTLTVKNRGQQPGTAQVEIFDGDGTGGGTPLKTQTLTLNVNQTATVTGSFTTTATTFLLTAIVDRTQQLLESDETNNRARRFLRQLPDLALGYDGVTFIPAAVVAGDAVEAAITVRNGGTDAAPASEVALFSGEPGSGGVELARGNLDPIAAGGNRTVRLPWTAAGGLNKLVVVVDPDKEVLELSESNNEARRELAVPRPTGPNLQVSAISRTAMTHSSADLSIGGTVGVTLANPGSAPVTGSFLLQLFEDADGDQVKGAADREVGGVVVDDDVAAGGTLAVAVPVTGSLSFYRSLVVVHVDAADSVAETREDDNKKLLFGDCETPPPASSFAPVEKWWVKDVEVQNAPVVVQLSDDNGDGAIDSRDNPDVVFHGADAQGRAVIAVSGLDGSRLWTFRSTANNPLQSEKANLSAADLDGDGVAEIVAVQTNNRLVALDRTGAVRWVSDNIEGTGGDWRGGSAIGDLDGDGVPEIVVGRAVLSNTGKRIAIGTANAARNDNWYGPLGTGYLYDQQHAIIADVDLDGRNEVVAGDTVYRLENGVLRVVWDYDQGDYLLLDGFSAVANLDGDPQAEIVYVSGGLIMSFNHDGSVRVPYRYVVNPSYPYDNVTFWGGPPTIADITGDGTPEILVAGDSELVAMNANLGTIWRKSSFDYAAMTTATAFDLDGDGKREVIYADENNLYVLNGSNGATLYQQKNNSLTGTELPVVADVDNDGQADIILPSSHDRRGDRSTIGVHALSHPSWTGTRPIWNQHSYHVTNVQLDGTVPRNQTPAWQLQNSFRANLQMPKRTVKLPNLTLGLPRVKPATAQGIPVVLRVGNGGPDFAPAGVEVSVYQTGVPAPVGTVLTTQALEPGSYQDVTVYWQGALSQPVDATATVDPAQKVVECDRGDNTIAFQVAEPLLPDLAILPPPDGVTLPSNPIGGQVLSAQVKVKNDGRAGAPATLLRVFDGSGPGTRQIGETQVPTLAPGEQSTLGVSVDTLGIAAGLHSLRFVVDPLDAVPEVEEANNTALVQLTLGGPTKPDLHATTLVAQPAAVTAGQPVLLRAEILNRGVARDTGFEVAFRVNGAEVGRVEHPAAINSGERVTVQYELSTFGRKGTLLLASAADPSNVIAEESESNNAASTTLSVLASPLTLSATTNKPRYKPSETVQVTISAFNAGTAPAAVTLVVAIKDPLGATVSTVAQQAVTLPVGAASFAYAWPVGQTIPGPYAVVGTFQQAGVALAEGSASFSISPDVHVEAELLTDRSSYEPNRTVILHGGVRNASAGTLLDNATATVRILGPTGAEAMKQTIPIAQVLPGGFVPVSSTWPVGTSAPGNYTAELRVTNAFNELLATATSPFHVDDSSQTGAGLRGTLAVTPRLQGAGGPVAATYRIDNHGNAAIPGLVVHLELFDLAAGESVTSVDRTQPIAIGASVDGTWRLDTTGLEPGNYLVSLAAVVGGQRERLASEPVSVLPGLLVDDLEVREGDSGSSTASVVVRLLAATDQTVTVEYATADAAATAGSDYEGAAGTLTFAPGETSKSIAVTIHGDLDEELHETFLVNLTAPSSAVVADGQAVVTIEDEEGCASTNLLQNPRAEEAAEDESVPGWQSTGAGVWRLDFAAPPSFDGLSYFAATAGAAAELRQDVTLVPFASLADAGTLELVFEGFVWSSGASRVVVEYRDAAGQVLDSYDSGVVAAGEGWQSRVDRRFAPPGTRSARVRLLATGAGKAGFDRLALRSLGVVTASAEPRSFAEGAGSAGFDVELSCANPAALQVSFTTADLEAVAGSDYTTAAGTLSFAAGALSRPVAVPLLVDNLDEDDERFALQLSSDDVIVLTPQVIGTILDDDGTVTLTASPAAVTEGDSGTVAATFALTLSAPSGRQVSVGYATKNGSAVAGSDFQNASGTVTFAPGQTEREVVVAVNGDVVDELVETFQLQLSNPTNVVLAGAAASATIVDDDTAEIAAVDAEVVEADSPTVVTAKVPVTLSVPSDRPISVAYTTVAGTAATPADFATTSGTLNFAPGTTQQLVSISVVADNLEETTESLLLRLSNPTNAELADPEATVTLIDDDGPVLSIDDVTLTEGNSGTKEFLFTVRSAPASTRTVTVDVVTADREATAGQDYNAVSTSLTFAPGQTVKTVSVTVIGEKVEEPDETFVARLEHPTNAAVSKVEGIGKILDDDVFLITLADMYLVESKPAAVLKLKLNRAPEDPISVTVTTVDDVATAGADYTATTQTVTFPPGSAEQQVPVPFLNDTLQEGPERFWVDLSSPVNAHLVRPRAGIHVLDDEKPPGGYSFLTTIRDFKPGAHPDIHNCGSVPRPADILGADGKMVYASGGTGQANFDQWYRDVLGLTLSTTYDAFFSKPGNYQHWRPGSYFPIDGQLYGNEGSHNYQFTVEAHGWFVYENNATILFGTDDDGWCYINNKMAMDIGACHGPSSRTVNLNSIASSHGLVLGEAYRIDCFMAERGQGESAYYWDTPLYLQQFEPGTINYSPNAATTAEGTTPSFKVQRIGGMFGPITAAADKIGGAATSPDDFLSLPLPISFPHKDRTDRTVNVPLVNDNVLEGDELLTLGFTGTNPAAAIGPFSQAAVTIVDDEAYPVAGLLTPVVSEGSRGEQVVLVGIKLDGENRYGAAISYTTANGTAIANSDYRTLTGTVQMPAGMTHTYVELRIIGDTTPEPDEYLNLVLTGAGIRGGSATLRLDVVDDDRCGATNLLANPDFEQLIVNGEVPGWTRVTGTWGNYSHGSSWNNYNVLPVNTPLGELSQTIDLSGYEELVDRGGLRFAFRVETANWGAENPIDTSRFVMEFRDAANNTVLYSYDSREGYYIVGLGAVMTHVATAPPGSRWLRVRIIGKRYTGVEANAHFDRAVLHSLDVPSIDAADVSVTEGQSGTTTATATVRMACSTTRPVTVDYSTQDGTAKAGDDYQSALGTLTIPAGQTSIPLPLVIVGDTLTEGNQTFTVRLQNPSGAVVSDGEALVTIVDDERKLAINNGSKNEGNEGSSLMAFSVTLDGTLTLPVTVDYATRDYSALAGEDYVAASGTLTFDPGQTSKTINVEVLGDTKVEPDEEFFVELSNPNNAGITSAQAMGKIKQDDLEIKIADGQVAEGNSGTRQLIFELTLSGASSQAVTVAYATSNLQATAGADYVATSGTLTFNAGEVLKTLAVTVNGDTAVEGSETFLLTLSNPQNAFVLNPEATGFIIDDDDCPSVNLLVNPGAETALVAGEIPGWVEVVGTTWSQRNGSPSPIEGGQYFAAGTVPVGELAQDVDVTPFAEWIDAGLQRFSFEGYVQSSQTPPDTTRVVVEYRDANGALASWDSGEDSSVNVWRYLSDLRLAPAGTRTIRVRLIATRKRDSGFLFAFFDGLSLRSLGTPVVLLADHDLVEGDDTNVILPYQLKLSCATQRQVSLSYNTADGTAKAPQDYIAASGSVTYAPGETAQTANLELVGDFYNEIKESFRIQISNVVNAVVLDTSGEIVMRDADPGQPPVQGSTRIYTLDQDFDLGALVGTNHDTPNNNQLQLSPQGGTFPFIWIAASNKGTIIKIDTLTGQVMAEYSTNPDNRAFPNPSRTTVALDGSVWVGNRGESSVAHVGLPELGQCIDRNGNGFIETSAAQNDIRPWPNANGADNNGGVSTAADECILHYVRIRETVPRHVSVDRDGNIWVGGYEGSFSNCFELLDGRTGAILRQVCFSCGGYGGFVDANGILWSSGLGPVLRWDPAQPTSTARCLGVQEAYGLAIAADGTVYANQAWQDRIWRISSDGNTITNFPRGSGCAQGLAIDANNQIWSSSSRHCATTRVSHRKTDGSLVGYLDGVPLGSTGVAVDAQGKIWVAADQASQAFRIDPTKGPLGADGVTRVGAVDLVVNLPEAFPYNYSDMTGWVALRSTARQGSWSVIQDAQLNNAEWGILSWNTEPQASLPPGTSVVVEVRTANTVPALGPSPWLTVQNGVAFERFGRYMQVRVTLKLGNSTVSPVLSDLRIGIQEPDVRVGNATVTEGDSGTKNATFAVTLSESVSHAVTIAYETRPGTATAGSDYTHVSGSLVIPPGGTSATITVPVLGDTDFEEDETFTVQLLSAAGAKLVDPTGDGLIVDDDGAVNASKVDALLEDRDGNGVVTPGDVVGYTVTIHSIANQPFSGLTFEDPTPANSSVLAGSVTTDSGQVTSQSPVRVALGTLAPGATATVRFAVVLAVPWPAGVTELVNQGRVTGLPSSTVVLTDDPDAPGAEDPTVTAIANVPVLVAGKRDALHDDRDGDGHASPGDLLRYTVELRNNGIAPASAVVFQDVAPAYTSIVAGSVAASAGTVESQDPVRVRLDSFASNAAVTITFDVEVDWPVPPAVDEVSNQGTVTSAELPAVLTDDPDVPGRQDPTVTPLVAAPRLAAAKVDQLAVDADNDGVPSPGDTIGYTITIANAGNTAATAVAVLDAIPEHTTLVAGSVTSSIGDVTSESPVQVETDELAAGEQMTVAFQVRIVNPIEPWVVQVANQARVWSAEVAEFSSDDPDVPGEANPTVTAVSASPVLTVAKTDVLYEDGNGDGFTSPGEVVLYQLTIGNGGNTAATDVRLTDAIPALTTLVAGTVQTSQGTITSESPIDIALGDIAVGGTATVSFRVRIDSPFPESASTISNQASVSAAELAPVLSDDPETPALQDATVSEVVIPIEVSVGDVSVTESAGSAVLPVVLSRAFTRAVSVAYATTDGSAAAGADYTTTSGTLTIPAGSTSGQIVVPVLDDPMDEPDEGFALTLSSPVSSVIVDGEATGTIVDDDLPPVLTVADVGVTEGNAGTTAATFTFTLSTASAFPISVNYSTAAGTATVDADFTAATGTVSFAPGETSKQVSVNVLGDLLDEADETFRLLLADAVSVTLAQPHATATIVDDDQPPALSIADVTVNEGNTGTVAATFAVTLTAPSGREISVRFATANVEATAGTDYAAATGTLVIPAGATTSSITVNVNGDLSDEPNERFEVRLSEPSNVELADAVGVGTIVDDDGQPALAAGDVTVHEGDGDGFTNVDVPITLSVPSGYVVTVQFTTADGTATTPQDYLSSADTAVIPAGGASVTVRLKVRKDVVDELNETFLLRLSNVTNASLADAEGTITIVDDDEALASVNDVTVAEGHSGTTNATFTIRLSTTSDREVRLDYATANGTATAPADYQSTSGTAIFAPGETERTVNVPVVGDLVLEEAEETFRLELSHAVNTAFADPIGVGTILDDELCPGLNLLVNGDAEARMVNGNPAGWTEVAGNAWKRVYRGTNPAAYEGLSYFAPGTFTPSGNKTAAELSQTVSLAPFAALIDGGDQRFLLQAAVRTGAGSADQVRVVVEYRNAGGAVLESYDSGAFVNAGSWRELVDLRLAPAGARSARVRLIAPWGEGNTLESYFDAVSLRPLRVAGVMVDDLVEYEGNSGQHDGKFVLRLACPYWRDVEVAYATADVKAKAGLDYLATAGTAVLPAGTTSKPVPVPILGDTLYEGHEKFRLDLTLPPQDGDVALLDPQGTGLILDDDFCARTPGYWKTHPELWPVDYLVLGGREYEKAQLLVMLDYDATDAASSLARHLIATKLDLLVGGEPSIVPTVERADAFLAANPPGSDPQGAARDEGLAIKELLERYNTTKAAGCTETAPLF